MKTSTLVVLVVLITLCVSLGSVWLFPSVQDFMAANAMWNGVSRFTRESSADGIDTLQPSNLDMKGTVVSVAYLDYTEDDLASLDAFVKSGGTLMLLDDFGFGNRVLEYMGIEGRFSHADLLDPLFCYKSPYLPVVTDFSGQTEETREIMLNHATALTGVPEAASAAAATARSSTSSFLDLDSSGSWDEGEPRGPLTVAATYTVGQGQVVAISDPSVILNSSVSRFDNSKFVSSLLAAGQSGGGVVIDLSRLAKSPLDVSKSRLEAAKGVIASPQLLAVLVAIVLSLSGILMVAKGGTLERERSR